LGEVALVSDIHANLEAFSTVLADIRKRGVREILCLGDIVGYGPDPRECLDLCHEFSIALLGNHEEALLYYAEDFNEKARQAIEWTKERLNDPAFDRESNYRIWNFLDGMPRSSVWNGALLVHASPRNPTKEYILPQDLRNPQKLEAIFGVMKQRLCFCGHSHVPGVYTDDLRFVPDEAIDGAYVPDARKTIVNVGSVGQPRDGDPRACYVLFDGSQIRFVRLEYDFRETMAKIRRVGALPDFLAERLARGR